MGKMEKWFDSAVLSFRNRKGTLIKALIALLIVGGLGYMLGRTLGDPDCKTALYDNGAYDLSIAHVAVPRSWARGPGQTDVLVVRVNDDDVVERIYRASSGTLIGGDEERWRVAFSPPMLVDAGQTFAVTYCPGQWRIGTAVDEALRYLLGALTASADEPDQFEMEYDGMLYGSGITLVKHLDWPTAIRLTPDGNFECIVDDYGECGKPGQFFVLDANGRRVWADFPVGGSH